VLVGTGRRAGLLGGFLRLAAPAPAVAWVLRVTGLHRQLDIFATVQAAITSWDRGQRRTDGTADAYMDAAASTLRTEPAPGKTRRPADAGELRPAIAAVLIHADAWPTPTPTSSSPPPCTPWPAPTRAPATPALARAAHSLLSVLTTQPSPPHRRSQLPPAVFAAFSTPAGGPHAGLRSPGERANAQLKTWRILRKLRCCPWRAGQLAKAIHVLQTRETGG
jgi:hypothetical protein